MIAVVVVVVVVSCATPQKDNHIMNAYMCMRMLVSSLRVRLRLSSCCIALMLARGSKITNPMG